MSDREQRQFVTVKMATAMTGVPERTLRRWMADGHLPATAAKGGRLVALDDVVRLAGQARPRRGHENGAATMAEDVATATAAPMATTAEQQLATLRDGLVAPLVALTERQQLTISEQAETIGRLTAERDALKARLSDFADQQATQASSDEVSPAMGMVAARVRLLDPQVIREGLRVMDEIGSATIGMLTIAGIALTPLLFVVSTWGMSSVARVLINVAAAVIGSAGSAATFLWLYRRGWQPLGREGKRLIIRRMMIVGLSLYAVGWSVVGIAVWTSILTPSRWAVTLFGSAVAFVWLQIGAFWVRHGLRQIWRAKSQHKETIPSVS